jgi:hypothetical protein
MAEERFIYYFNSDSCEQLASKLDLKKELATLQMDPEAIVNMIPATQKCHTAEDRPRP